MNKTRIHKPKALELFEILQMEEIKEVEMLLIGQKRLRLIILLNYFKDLGDGHLTDEKKEEIYFKLFNEPFDPKKDYLLRNEFRLLAQEIEDYLIKSEMEKELKQNSAVSNLYLLKAFQERKSIDLFQKEYKSAYEDALKNSDHFSALNLTRLNFLNFSQFLLIKEKDERYLEELNRLKLTHLSCFYLSAYRQQQIDMAYSRTFFYPFSIHERPIVSTLKVEFGEYENIYTNYLFEKAKSYVVPHKKRIGILVNCLKIVQEHFRESSFYEEELKFCYSNLGKAYSMLFEFEKANEYYQLYFDIPAEKDDPNRLAILCDYLMKLVKLGQIEKTIDLINENKPYYLEIEKLRSRFLCLEIACYAYLRLPDKLHKILPQNYTDYSIALVHFFRFYEIIYAYLEEDKEDAYRLCQNLKNSVGKKELFFDVVPVVNFFNRFFYILVNMATEMAKRRTHQEKLLEDINGFSAEALPEYRAYLPLLWVKLELTALLEKK